MERQSNSSGDDRKKEYAKTKKRKIIYQRKNIDNDLLFVGQSRIAVDFSGASDTPQIKRGCESKRSYTVTDFND